MVKAPIQVFGIEGRYAGALYSAASKNKILEVVEKDLTAFQKEMKADEKLRDFIMDPSIDRAIKANALKEVCAQIKFNPATGFLMHTMAENGRLKKMDGVINAYKLIMAAHRGEVVCEVITAKPLEAGQRSQLEASLKVSHKLQIILNI